MNNNNCHQKLQLSQKLEPINKNGCHFRNLRTKYTQNLIKYVEQKFKCNQSNGNIRTVCFFLSDTS